MLPVIEDHERSARERLPPEIVDYVAAGSWDEVTAAEAVAAWTRLRLRPRVLRPVGEVRTATRLLGTSLRAPLAVGPVAFHRLVHPEGERATAAGVAGAGSLMVVPTRASVRIERVAEVGAPWWFQVYVLRDRGLTEALVGRAVAAGASALVLTGDTPQVAGKRRSAGPVALSEEDYYANLSLHLAEARGDDPATWQDPAVTGEAIGWLAELSGLPVLVKGVLRGDDALACLAAGAAGVVVSNHGGRQLDRAVPTAWALGEVAEAVGGRGLVLVDGGVRDGLSMLAALALGADAVLVGRPVLWALAAGGAAAVTALLSGLAEDLRVAMALAGAAGLEDLSADLVVRPRP